MRKAAAGAVALGPVQPAELEDMTRLGDWLKSANGKRYELKARHMQGHRDRADLICVKEVSRALKLAFLLAAAVAAPEKK